MAGTSKRTRRILRVPEEAVDRVYAMTENLRFRHFVRGAPLSGIGWSWLFICFERSIPYRVATAMRVASGLDVEQWGFYTFDEEKLKELHAGGDPPEVNVMAFSGIEAASTAMDIMGAPKMVGDLELRAELSYIIFAKHDFLQTICAQN